VVAELLQSRYFRRLDQRPGASGAEIGELVGADTPYVVG
jgi:hypothetical protein